MTEGAGEVINLGGHFEISIGDTTRTIAEVMNREIEILADQQRLRPERNDVKRLLAPNKKARDLLGWQPQYRGLEAIRRRLGETVAWLSAPARLASYKPGIYNV